MPTLTQGQSVTLQMSEGESWTVTPTGQAQISTRGVSGGPLQAPTTIATATTFGPYTESGTLTIFAMTGSATYTGSELASLVSGAWIGLWADRATAVAGGYTTAFFTDIGVGGSYYDYLGGKWRAQARRVILKNLITAVSNNAAPKSVMDYAMIPAALWQDGDLLEINVLKTREGGTSDTDATDLMIGSAPTTLGTTTGFSSSALATTAIQFSMEHRLRRESATSVRTLRVAGGGGGLGTSTSLTTLTTGLPNMDTNDVYIQITSDLTTAGGEVSWLRAFTVELISGA